MADLTRPDRGEAMQQMTAKIESLDSDEVGAYFLLCMAILVHNAPDVARFIMDRADERLADADEELAPAAGGGSDG